MVVTIGLLFPHVHSSTSGTVLHSPRPRRPRSPQTDLRWKGYPPRLFFSKRNRIHVDIWFFKHLGKSGRIREGDIFPPRWKRRAWDVNSSMIFPLASCELEGATYPCPRDSRGWLAGTYGASWEMPALGHDDGMRFKTCVCDRRGTVLCEGQCSLDRD